MKDGFDFDHPAAGESDVDFARRLVTKDLGAEHVANLDWDRCLINVGCDWVTPSS